MSVCLTTNIGSVYWPVYGLYFNPIYKQGDRYNPPIENADNPLNSSIAISNTLQKQSKLNVSKTNEFDLVLKVFFCLTNKVSTNISMAVYTCTDGIRKQDCYESIDDPDITGVISENDPSFLFDDGGCCEDLSRNPVCCIITLNRAASLKYLF